MKGWRDRIKPEHTKLFGACLLSILIPFVLINLMPGTKGRYSMPVYPLLSVLAAWVLCREEELPELVKTLCRRLLELALLLLAAGGVTGSILTQNPLHLLVPAIASVIFLFTWKHREELNRAAALASLAGLGALAGMISYVIFIMPMTMKNEQCFSLGAKINEVSAPARNIFIYGLGNEAFMFYLKPSLRFINSSDDLPKEACTLLMLQGKESQQLLSDLQFKKRLPQRLACFKDDDLFYEVYRLGPAYKEGMRIPSDTRSLVEAN
ncbi:MAG: hypothetical protein A2X49_01080 [Lentisphaerae bacterium GWF2_52_8]|nr:MAG: hypothetical protein A2X49_01080 [Lentisphaerae bacterium GWF2_52_8]